ncbi:membrane protein insertase YidC [Alteromonas sp. ASW11-36]|uniref:Membrane protein insertase YidC n=1 Tax=Alteromonas arenosi TaxID=3055817 RepID=A0ABT7ST53_9ALTE|nr:membrane protein insertase YidC [Alteromonas sp. ASW11-36]MDM7859341.1 membrane protein insertase YidC [Alteromonas sp. ASW11-36]
MESQRSFLLIGLVLVSFLLWTEWQKDYGPQPIQPVESTTELPAAANGVPSATPAPNAQSAVPEDITQQSLQDVPGATPIAGDNANGERFVTVETDALAVTIDLIGGDVVVADLKLYPEEQGSEEPFQLLQATNPGLYVAQGGLIGPDGPDSNPSGRPIYSVASNQFTLDGDTLSVPLTWANSEGLVITKTFTFARNSHVVDVSYTIQNGMTDNARVQQYAQLKQTTILPETGSMFMPTYRGSAYSTQDERYEKFAFGDFEDESLRIATLGGWVGMLEHYFVSAWVPPQDQNNTIYSNLLNNEFAIIGYTTPAVVVAPGSQETISSTLYIGPKDQETLAGLARGLDLTVDYGPLFWISQPLFDLLQWLFSISGNWGVAIILITIIVKGAMYWLTKKQYESFAKLRVLAPKMQQLKDRYGDDRQKMSQAMMELYKKEKVNPMGGCFPLLLQMPIFLALYWVLLESVELRHADFALWITDLSVMDPYFVLPVLTGASMYLLQKLNPTTVQDPMQQKIMQWMPVAMSIFFIWFPAGLVLYWLISNVITIIQAKLIYRSMEKRGIQTH